MVLYLGVLVGAWLVRVVPRPVAYRLGSLAGLIGYRFNGRARRLLLENLSTVYDRPETSSVIRRSGRTAFRNNGKNWVDSLLLGSVSPQEIERRVHVDGWRELAAAVSQGRGVILIGMHLGNVDVVGQIIAVRGLPVTIPVERTRPEALFRRTQKLRQRLGIQSVEVHASGRRLLRALHNGGIVALMADRNLTGQGIEVDFFGRPAVVSRGPAWLIAHSRAPVLIGAGLRQTDESFRASVARLDVQRTGDLRADELANAQIVMSAVESEIRACPDQWMMFAPVWAGEAEPDSYSA